MTDQCNTTTDLVSRLTDNWIAWGSPVDREKCINETCMAMDCKEAAGQIERLQWLISQVLDELPQKRDWLNPDIEREMRAVGKPSG